MSQFHLGDEPVTDRLNVAEELRVLRVDPLDSLIDLLDDDESVFLHHAAGQYVQAFELYVLSAERCLRNISIGARYLRQVKPFLGGGRRLTARQLKLSREIADRRRFFRVDIFNLLLHSRILLDKAIAFSRRILIGPHLPSFTSFAEHRKFFRRNPDAFSPEHRLYVRYLTDQTTWFDMPLKVARDKFAVHSGPAHFQLVVYSSEYTDIGLLFVMDGRNPWPEYPDASSVRVTARRMIRNVNHFLNWYNSYLVEALAETRQCTSNPDFS